MSTEVENQVVQMKFNNSAFEQGVAKTMGTLDALKSKLNFTGAKKGLSDLQSMGNNVSLAGIANSVDAINKKFSVMNIVGVATLTNIVNHAIGAGAQLIKSFTLAPLADGFHQYEQQIQATQTILSNTSAAGENLSSVTKVLDTLNGYANATVYNFSDMATAMGSFTSAGIKLKPASIAIQGMANVAAAAGSNAQQMANVLPQISQALSRGKVQAQDWMSVTNAGMASSNFKNAILETAKAMGTLKMPKTESIEQWTKKGGSFQQAMEKGEITSKVLSSTLEVMSGTLSDAELAQRGYTKEQIRSLQTMAKQARAAAVNVKSFSALKDNLQQGVGSAWAQVYKLLVGDLPHATKLFTKLSDVLNKLFVDPVNHLHDLLMAANKWGFLLNLTKSFTNIFKAFAAVIKPIHDAFREIFPPTTAYRVAQLMFMFRLFTESLIISGDQADNLRKIFKLVFGALKIVIGVIGFAIKGVFNIFSIIGQLAPGLLALLGSVSDVLTKFVGKLTHPGPVNKFFKGLNDARTAVLIPLAHFLSLVAEALASLIDGDYSGFTKKFKTAFSSLGDVASAIGKVVTDRFKGLIDTLSEVGDFFTMIGTKAANSTSGFVRSVGRLATSIGKFLGEFTSGAGEKVIQTIQKVTESVRSMISHLSFKMPNISFGSIGGGAEKSAAQLGKLAVVGKALSSIWKGVAKTFTGVGHVVGPTVKVIFEIFHSILAKVKDAISHLDFQDAIALLNTGFLIAMYRSFNKFMKSVTEVNKNLALVFKNASGTIDQMKNSLKTLQNSVRAKIIERIAIAVGILAASAYVLAKIDPKKLAFALGALTALFVQLMASLAVFTKLNLLQTKGVLKTGGALVLLAVAVAILAGALKILASMSWKEIKRGLAAMALIMAELGVIVRVMNGTKGVFSAAAGMLILAGALTALSVVLIGYAHINTKTLHEGLGAIALVVLALGLALRAMPKDMPKIALALIVLTGVLVVLAGVIEKLGNFKHLVKGIVGLGAALAILVIAVTAMEGAQPGAVALLLVAVALRILIPQLIALGNLSLWGIIKALGALTVALIIIAAASVLLVEAVPFIAAFGAALVIFGAGLLLAGAGTYLFVSALSTLVAIGTVGIAGLLQLLPLFATQVANAIIAFMVAIRESAPKIEAGFVAIVNALLDGLQQIGVKLIDVVGNLIMKLVDRVAKDTPHFVTKGIEMLNAFLKGIDDNIYQITSRGISIATKFLKALGDKAPDLVKQGFATILAFINALSEAIDYYAPEIRSATGKLAMSIADGITFGLASKGIKLAHAGGLDMGLNIIKGIAHGLDSNSPSKKAFKQGEYAGQGLILGLSSYQRHVNSAADAVGSSLVDKMQSSIQRLYDVATGNIDMTPTIAPVIDLTEVRKGAAQMATLLAANPVNANISLDQAKVVSTEHAAVQQSNAQTADQPQVVREVKLEQNNYSPKALSTTEIYRRTNNQIALAKQALSRPASVPA